MEDDEEWDLATIQELDRIAEQATAARRQTQPPPTSTPSASPSYIDDWDHGMHLSWQLQQQDQRQESHETLKKPRTTVGERKFCNGKTTQDPDLFRPNAESSGCAAMQTSNQTSQAESLALREPTGSVQADAQDSLQLQYSLQQIWCPKLEGGCKPVQNLFIACETELHALLRFEEGNAGSSNSKLHECLTLVLQGAHEAHTLIFPLRKFLDANETWIVQCALKIFLCLLMNDQQFFESSTDSVDSNSIFQPELEGFGWKSYTPVNAFYNSKANRHLGFSSPRITFKSTTEGSENERQSHGDEDRQSDFIKCILRLALNHVDSAVKVDALSLIFLYVARTNPLQERFRIGAVLVDGGISALLRGRALDVQLQVLRIVHLLFNCKVRNCSKIFATWRMGQPFRIPLYEARI